jgi:hypothetical protein
MFNYLRRTRLAVLVCKALFITVCLFMILSGHFPPSHAQDTPSIGPNDSANVYGLEVRTGMQQVRMDGLSGQISEIKANELRMSDELRLDSTAISNMNGELAGIGAILMMLQIGSVLYAAYASRKHKGTPTHD